MASFQRSLKQQSSLLPSIPPFQQPGSSHLPLESGPLPWSLSQQAPPDDMKVKSHIPAAGDPGDDGTPNCKGRVCLTKEQL